MTRILRAFPKNQNNVDRVHVKQRPAGEQTRPLTVLTEKLIQLLLIHVVSKVFDVDVGELFGPGTQLSLTLFTRFKSTHKPVLKGHVA